MPEPRLGRRAPLGFGTHEIHDKPITLSTRCSRDFLLERVLVIGDGYATAVRVRGVSVDAAVGPLTELPTPIDVPANTLIEVDICPKHATPPPSAAARVVLRLLRRYRIGRWIADRVAGRERSVSVGAKGFV